MPGDDLQWLDLGSTPTADARRIAYLATPAAAHVSPPRPTLLWLAGLKSDMISTKATALAHFADAEGYGLTRFDYSGHGRSSGAFTDATIGAWIEEARAVFLHATRGPVILIGSSTGAYIALLLIARLLGLDVNDVPRVRALILIAPAWDLTEKLMWDKFTAETRAQLMEKGLSRIPSGHDEPYVISRRFIEEGRTHLLSDMPFDPGRPVHVLQGGLDMAVPPAHARALATVLRGSWLTIEEIPDATHSLSRPEDIARLLAHIRSAAGAV